MSDEIGLQMMDDRMLVIPIEEKEEKRTAGGIIVPATSREKPTKGTVVAVGPGSFVDGEIGRRPMGVKPGDVVLHGQYAGSVIVVDDAEYLMLRESDVIARVEG